MGFNSSRIAALQKAFEVNATLAHRKIALEVFGRVVRKTPVDSGHARANWQCGVETVPSGTLESTDKSGTTTQGAIAAKVAAAGPDQTLHLVNHLPYVEMLEYGGYAPGPGTTGGFSKQAPAGMVRQTLAEYFGIAREIVDEAFRR